MKNNKKLKFLIISALSFLLLLSSVQTTHAASPTYGSTKTFGGTGTDTTGSIIFDSDGNLYINGTYSETVNFDTTGGTDNHTSNGGSDIYITKYNADDSYAWTRTFGGSGGDSTTSIETDADGNVYVSGYYKEIVNFDGTGGTDNHTSNGGGDAFITKYNSDGSYGFTKTFGGTPSSRSDQISDIQVDSNNNLYLGGIYYSTADFDPSAGLDNRTSNGDGDAFISKHNSDGSYAWTRTWGSTASGSDTIYSVSLDAGENLIVCGDFALTVDFDDTGGTDNHTSNGGFDAAFVKYNSDGSYGWTKTFGGADEDTIRACTLDSNGNYFLTGWTAGTVDFDNTSGTDIHTSTGPRDIFVTKYNSDFSYGWTNVFGGAGYDWPNTIEIDSLGNIFVAGVFQNTIDFDPTAGVENHTANAVYSGFIIKYNSDESYGWTVSFDNSGYTFVPTRRSLNVDESGNLYATGLFNGSVDFDISEGVDIRSGISGSIDAFVTKLGYDITGPLPNIVTPSGYTNSDTQPTLIFKKAVDTGSGMGTYSVYLDNGKERSFSVGGIPSTGNGTANYLWRDDDTVRVEFANEQDSDTNNDEIRVYFKGLNDSALTQGQHTWEVVSTDIEINQTSTKTDFYLDQQSPTINDLSVTGVESGRPGGDATYVTSRKVYRLDYTQRMPTFSGRATDKYLGSTKTNVNDTTDTFPPVAAGPKTLILNFSKLTKNTNPDISNPNYEKYRSYEFPLNNIIDDPGIEKYTNFYATTPYPLEDGYYKVNLLLRDGADNSYDYDEFFLTLNYKAPLLSGDSGSGLKVVEEDAIPVETEEERQRIEKEGVIVKVKIVDEDGNPLGGVKVTLVSKENNMVSDKRGRVLFANVALGKDIIEVDYKGQGAFKAIVLTSDYKEYRYTLQLEQTKKFSPLSTLVIIMTIFLVILLSVLLLRKRRERQEN